MNAQWATAAIAALGLAGQLLWTLINLRIENRILSRIEDLKDWADDRFVRRDNAPIHAPLRVNGPVIS